MDGFWIQDSLSCSIDLRNLKGIDFGLISGLRILILFILIYQKSSMSERKKKLK